MKKCFHSFHPYHTFLKDKKFDCVNGKETEWKQKWKQGGSN